jgi:hypothetical protein
LFVVITTDVNSDRRMLPRAEFCDRRMSNLIVQLNIVIADCSVRVPHAECGASAAEDRLSLAIGDGDCRAGSPIGDVGFSVSFSARPL